MEGVSAAQAERASANKEAALARLAARRSAASASAAHSAAAVPTHSLRADGASRDTDDNAAFDAAVDDDATVQCSATARPRAYCCICAEHSRPIEDGIFDAFRIAVCARCRALDPELWRTVTKGTARADYLLTNETLDGLPFIAKANPKQFRAPMKLYLVKQLVAAANTRWSDAAGLAVEHERRVQVREERVRERFRAKQSRAELSIDGPDSALNELRILAKQKKRKQRGAGAAAAAPASRKRRRFGADGSESDSSSSSSARSDSDFDASLSDESDDDGGAAAAARTSLVPAVAGAISAIAEQDAAAAARKRALRARLLSNLSVSDLKSRCKAGGLAVGGRKAALVERILEGRSSAGRPAKPQKRRAAPAKRKASVRRSRGGGGGGGGGGAAAAAGGHVHAFVERWDGALDSWVRACDGCGVKVAFELA